MENYAVLSIETHLFFARIMREHALFLEAGFPCKETAWIQKADWLRRQFEALLRDVTGLANGRVGSCILNSGEVVTEFTIPAERKTEGLSGIPIDSRISRMQHRLLPGCPRRENRELNRIAKGINRRAMELLKELIRFKEAMLQRIGEGELFNTNYPLLIEHILREAKLYRATIEGLERNDMVCYEDLRETERFWNRIMMEHALFIRGLLDPTEEELIDMADGFAEDYKRLLEMAKRQDMRAMDELTRKSLEETIKYREFKATGAEGILDNKIASIILPLLADHVLREANHYIRLLSCDRRA
ncbi:DUF2935 domain-containing protein [Acetivibrio ethanolgignens]|uniref:DUF2935 domain-containing protein n=1 Tax=Acetivibrio ethanolgignens TaxID=290052 RepID=A0A0V8QGD7_9FIRM|nr:DUF2935 domain-containing protein [Acetivibrio ethanolgignens]KSV59623.1 hypothetical protein ASU35_01115 [Acetivibrio ethanolgignens]